MIRRAPRSTLFPFATLLRAVVLVEEVVELVEDVLVVGGSVVEVVVSVVVVVVVDDVVGGGSDVETAVDEACLVLVWGLLLQDEHAVDRCCGVVEAMVGVGAVF